jgi:hypothetical protein
MLVVFDNFRASDIKFSELLKILISRQKVESAGSIVKHHHPRQTYEKLDEEEVNQLL